VVRGEGAVTLLRVLAWTAGSLGLYYVVRRFLLPQGPPFPSCSREFTAARHGPSRSMSSVRLVVLHATDPGTQVAVPNPTARSTAEYFSETDVPASTQLVVGQDGCYRTLDDDVTPYGAGSPANERGLHVEQAGHSDWTRAQWLARDATLRAAGGAAGGWCREYGIPCVFRDAAALQKLEAEGWPPDLGGVTTHAEVTKAWHHTTHTDPGAGYPIDVVMRYAGA
jgi:hypothetical protein